MNFNVLYEPWIPVIGQDGQKKEMGIMSLLCEAHRLKAITSPSPVIEYGIVRLLCAFLMDSLRPEVTEDLEDLLDEGQFPMARLESYVDQCLREGVTFDLFDAKRPFLQSAADSRWDSDKNIKPISELNYEIPSGNNHTLFQHAPGDYTLTPAEAARFLCGVNVFCTPGLKGPSYVNSGAPPLYVVVQGDSLWQTLLFSCVPQKAIDLPFDDPPVNWRNTGPVEPDKAVSLTSVLFGMTFPTRRLLLLPEKDTLRIRRMYFQKGLKYQGFEAWVDPHVAYAMTDKGRLPLRPQLEKDAWRNTGYLLGAISAAGRTYQAPLVVRQYHRIRRGETVRLCVYGVATNQASYLDTQRAELTYSGKLLDNSLGISMICDGLDFSEKAAYCLKKNLQSIGDKSDERENLVFQAMSNYYATCQRQFWSQLCPQATEADINRPETRSYVDGAWKEAVCAAAREEFLKSMEIFATEGKSLLIQGESERRLNAQLKKLKGGDV